MGQQAQPRYQFGKATGRQIPGSSLEVSSALIVIFLILSDNCKDDVIDELEYEFVPVPMELVGVSLEDAADGVENEGIFQGLVFLEVVVFVDIIVNENGFFNTRKAG